MKNIQVLILAGGIGKRMWPIKKNKNLLPFFGKPLIEHQIEGLRKAGFQDLIIIIGPEMKGMIKVKAKIVVQEKPLGQADAILSAKKVIKNAPLLILNANDFYQPGLLAAVKRKAKTGIDACLVGLKTDRYLPMGYLVVEKGLVKGIVEKPGEGKEPSKIIRLVVDFYQQPKLLLEFLQKTRSKDDNVYEVAMAAMIKKGVKFGLVQYNQAWATIKRPWDILSVVEFFLKERKKEGVVKEKGVKIFAGAVVKNSYIGKNVVIGNNALVRDSIIEAGSVIGYGSEIARSYVGPNCWFHANYIGDSVIEANVAFGSGARTANLRLDEREIVSGRIKLGAIVGEGGRVGINTSLMPGVQIGSYAFVGPGLVLKENLQENQFCYLKQSLVVKKNLQQPDPVSREVFRKKL